MSAIENNDIAIMREAWCRAKGIAERDMPEKDQLALNDVYIALKANKYWVDRATFKRGEVAPPKEDAHLAALNTIIEKLDWIGMETQGISRFMINR